LPEPLARGGLTTGPQARKQVGPGAGGSLSDRPEGPVAHSLPVVSKNSDGMATGGLPLYQLKITLTWSKPQGERPSASGFFPV